MSIVTVTPNYEPHSKQVLLHNAPVSWEDIMIILYGGSKGGGKSAGILMDAVMFCTTYPGAKAMILRENLSAVKQSFLDKLPTLLPEYVDAPGGEKVRLYEYKEKGGRYPDRTIVFPNGSYITFQRVENYNEALAKQGWEVHYLGIDEVTKQEKRSVMYLLSLLRSAKVYNPYTKKKIQIPTKAVFGCNPGGPGHKWVKEMFIDPTVIKKDPVTNAPIRTKDYITYVDDPDGDPIKMTIRFIPASWKDNPYLSKSYRAVLMMGSDYKRAMDMDGNWDIVAGSMFDFEEDSYLSAHQARMLVQQEENVDVYISIDWGYKPSYHAAIWTAVFEDSSAISFKMMYGQELIFEDFVKEIAERSEGLNIVASLLPHDMFRSGDRHRDDTGRIIGETKADVFGYHELNPVGVESGKGKVDMRYDKIHSASSLTMERNGKTIKRVRISEACSDLKDELTEAVFSEHTPGKIDPKSKDHAIDAFGHFLVYYSTDIAPLSFEAPKPKDLRPKLQRLLEEEEEMLFGGNNSHHSTIDIANDYEV